MAAPARTATGTFTSALNVKARPGSPVPPARAAMPTTITSRSPLSSTRVRHMLSVTDSEMPRKFTRAMTITKRMATGSAGTAMNSWR
jgi:hypothetical protein